MGTRGNAIWELGYWEHRSRWGDSNSRPTAYKAVALPLSYIGWAPGFSHGDSSTLP